MPVKRGRDLEAAARWACAGLGAYALAGGSITLLGWAAGIPRLTDWSGNGISMKANAAAASAAAGAAVLLLAVRPRWIAAVRALGAFTAVVGGLTLFEHVSGRSLGIDTLFFQEPPGTRATAAPGRMGPVASTSYLLIGSGLWMATSRLSRASPWLAVAAAWVASVSLVGYLFGVNYLYDIPRVTGIALQTTSLLVALTVSLMTVVPRRGLQALLADDRPGARLQRRLLVPIIVVPLALGWLRVQLQEEGLFDTRFGTAMLLLVLVALFLALVSWNARRIDREHAGRMEAEAGLAQRGERLALALRAAGAVWWEWTVGSDRLEWTPEYRELYGFGPEVPTVVQSWRDRLHPEDRDRLMQRVDVMLATPGDDEWKEEFRIVHPQKGVRWITGLGLLTRDVAGRPLRFSGINLDITDRKEAEVGLREAVRSQRLLAEIGDLAARATDTGTLIQAIAEHVAGELGVSRCGYARVDVEAGTVTVERDHHGALPSLRGEFSLAAYAAHFLEDGRAGRITAVGDLASDPRTAPVFEARYRPMAVRAHINVPLHRGGRWIANFFVSHHEPRSWTAAEIEILRSVAERVRLVIDQAHTADALREGERELRLAKEAAEAASKGKDRFIAVLSHELRTPLTPVVTLVQTLRSDPDLPAAAREDLMTIERNLDLEIRLIDDLLDLTRIARGQISLHPQPLELHQLVRQAAELCQADVRAKGLELEQRLEARRTVVPGDRARLLQVLWNVIRNGIKFTPPGGTITVGTASDGEHIHVSVTDTGIGIESGALDRIFRVFEQESLEVSRQFGGMGVGLALSRTIIDAHGGTIRAQSAGRGRGSTFTITLPLTSETVAAAEAPSGRSFGEGDRTNAALRVLLVEDHEDTARSMSQLLARQGWHVRTADSVAGALRSAEVEPFDVLVSDIGLPDGTGLDLMRQLAGRSAKTPKGIALSGFGMEQDVRSSREAGFAAHLVKPVNVKELIEAVQRVAGAPS